MPSEERQDLQDSGEGSRENWKNSVESRDFAAEYRAAVAEESEARDFAFLDLPREVCGIPLQQMTLRQLLVRLMIGCPFFCGRKPQPEDVASLLWYLSPDFIKPKKMNSESMKPGSGFVNWVKRHAASWFPGFRIDPSVLARRRFIREIVFPNGAADERVRELIAGIRDYIDWTFYDAPTTSAGNSTIAYTSFVAGYIDFLASEYDWSAISERPVLDTPLVVIYQLVNKLRKRLDPNHTILFNRKSDKVRADRYAAINATAAREAALRREAPSEASESREAGDSGREPEAETKQ